MSYCIAALADSSKMGMNGSFPQIFRGQARVSFVNRTGKPGKPSGKFRPSIPDLYKLLLCRNIKLRRTGAELRGLTRHQSFPRPASPIFAESAIAGVSKGCVRREIAHRSVGGVELLPYLYRGFANPKGRSPGSAGVAVEL
jgi:hypothetical protein